MNNEIKGSIGLVFLTALYGLYGVYSRMIGSYFGTFSQNWVRNGIIILLLLIYFRIAKLRLPKIKTEDRGWMLAWLLSGSFIMLFLFASFNNLPVSTVYFLFYSTMIASGFICGRIFFKEKMNIVKITSIFLAFLGLYLIYSFTLDISKIIYILMSLASGLILGFWNTVSKKFSHNYLDIQLVFYDAIVSAVVGFLGFLLIKEDMPSFTLNIGWIWILVYAITQITTVGLLIYGFRNLEAQIGSVIMPIEVIFASIFGYLILGESLTIYSIAGGLLIASAAFLPNITLIRNMSRKSKSISRDL